METIIVSACLLGEKCRYDGKDNYNENIKFLREHFDIVPICPEQFGGLPTPRDPSEQREGKVISSKGRDVTKFFEKGRDDVINIVKYLHIRKAVLVENSPSCGLTHVYNGRFNKTLIKGEGTTTKALRNLGVECFSIDEVEKLIDKTQKQIYEEREAKKAEREAQKQEKLNQKTVKKFDKDEKDSKTRTYKRNDYQPRNSNYKNKKDFKKKEYSSNKKREFTPKFKTKKSEKN